MAERRAQHDHDPELLRPRRGAEPQGRDGASTPTTPRSSRPTDNGITPIEYLLVGLASCLTAGVASVAQNRGIQLRSVESTVEGNHDIRGILGADSDVRNGFNDIKVTFNIDADASKEDIEALVAQSQKRSAVFDALTNPTDVTVEVV